MTKEKKNKMLLAGTIYFILIMNILGAMFWLRVVSSKPLLLFFTITTVISQFALWIIMKDRVLLKIGLYYWLYVLIMNVVMTLYLHFGTVMVVGLILRFFLILRARTFWLFSTSELLCLPSFDTQGGFLSKENMFIIFLILYGVKIKRVGSSASEENHG